MLQPLFSLLVCRLQQAGESLLLDAEVRCAADLSVRRLDAVADQLGSAVGERADTAPV